MRSRRKAMNFPAKRTTTMKTGICPVAFAMALAVAAAGCGDDWHGASAASRDPGAPLILVTTGEMPPYSYRDEATGEIVGEEIEIARAAAAKLGRALEVHTAKFPELIPMVSSGEADLAAAEIIITEGRRQSVDFSEPYATEGGMFLYRAGEPMPTIPRAERMRIAVMDASIYDFYLSSHGVDPIRYDSYPPAIKALRERRVDAVFYDSCTVRLVAEQSGGEFAASTLVTRDNFGIALGKGDAVLKAALDKAIAEKETK